MGIHLEFIDLIQILDVLLSLHEHLIYWNIKGVEFKICFFSAHYPIFPDAALLSILLQMPIKNVII